MSGGQRVRSFRHIKKKLKELNISWHPAKGKGSHGSFVGPDQQTGKLHAFPIPRNQQREINNDYFSRLRKRFGLEGKKWIKFFDSK